MRSIGKAPVGMAIFLKALRYSKTRLSHLSSLARMQLAAAMANDVLAAAAECEGVDMLLLVSSEPTADVLAARHGAELLAQPSGKGLNHAAAMAAKALRRRGMKRGIFIPADVPLVDGASLTRLTSALSARFDEGADLGIVPCRRDHGTNLLMFGIEEPPLFQYEGASFAAHTAHVRRPAVVRDFRLGLDVDGPDDLAELIRIVERSGQPPRWTTCVLADWADKVAA